MRRREKGRREKEEGEDKRRTGEWIQGAHYQKIVMLEKNHSFSATTTNTTTATTTSLVSKKLDKKHTANP